MIDLTPFLLLAAGWFLGLLSERFRRRYEDRHRHTDARRKAYGPFIGTLRKVHFQLLEGAIPSGPLDGAVETLYDQLNDVTLNASLPTLQAVTEVVEAQLAAHQKLGRGEKLSKAELDDIGLKVTRASLAMRKDVGTSSVKD